MGIRIIVEVLDHWQDAGLTAGERNDLLVLAENANDRTRETWPKGGVHQSYILKRTGKSAGGWKNAIGKLMKKGVLAYAVHGGRELSGFPGQAAVYRIAPLCPEAPHDGFLGQCARVERVTSQVTHSEGDGLETGHLSDGEGHLSEETGHLWDAERVTSQVTPTPLYPSSKTPSGITSSSVAEPSTDPSAVAPDTEEGGGGGSLDDSRSTAEEIASALDYRGKTPDKRQRRTIADRLTAALASGWTVDGLALYLDLGTAAVDSPAAVYAHRLKPEVLPDAEPLPAPPAARGGVRGRMPTAEEYANLTVEDILGAGRQEAPAGGMWEQATARARARMGGGTDSTVAGWAAVAADLGRREPHRPYTNDVWTTPANPTEAAGIPWCGDVECEPIGRMRERIDSNGYKTDHPCTKCHPGFQFG